MTEEALPSYNFQRKYYRSIFNQCKTCLCLTQIEEIVEFVKCIQSRIENKKYRVFLMYFWKNDQIYKKINQDRPYFLHLKIVIDKTRTQHNLEVGIYSIRKRVRKQKMKKGKTIVLKVWDEFFKSLTTQFHADLFCSYEMYPFFSKCNYLNNLFL